MRCGLSNVVPGIWQAAGPTVGGNSLCGEGVAAVLVRPSLVPEARSIRGSYTVKMCDVGLSGVVVNSKRQGPPSVAISLW